MDAYIASLIARDQALKAAKKPEQYKKRTTEDLRVQQEITQAEKVQKETSRAQQDAVFAINEVTNLNITAMFEKLLSKIET